VPCPGLAAAEGEDCEEDCEGVFDAEEEYAVDEVSAAAVAEGPKAAGAEEAEKAREVEPSSAKSTGGGFSSLLSTLSSYKHTKKTEDGKPEKAPETPPAWFLAAAAAASPAAAAAAAPSPPPTPAVAAANAAAAADAGAAPVAAAAAAPVAAVPWVTFHEVDEVVFTEVEIRSRVGVRVETETETASARVRVEADLPGVGPATTRSKYPSTLLPALVSRVEGHLCDV